MTDNTAGAEREALARVAFKVLHHWEDWEEFDARFEARGGVHHPSQLQAFEVVDAILAALRSPVAGDGVREARMLPPDQEDIRLIRDAVLPRCPCCTGTPSTFARHFEHSGVYQAYVHCSWCDVQVFKNARDLNKARELAIEAWSKRPASAPTERAGVSREVAEAAANIFAVPWFRRDPMDPSGTLIETDEPERFAELALAALTTPSAAEGRETCELCGVPDGRHEHDCPRSTLYEGDVPPAAPEDAGRLVEAFLPMETWDKRDEAVLLLVDYTDGEHALDDATIAITIGHNNDHNVGEGEGQGWQFAGWCWTHDHYVQGKGKPIGWAPLPHHLALAAVEPRHASEPAQSGGEVGK
jgi:hypothetical protein